MGFINYAHRGASSYAPENTMPAFELGVKMGANGIETDVQRTKDGILVLFHDSSLMRICGRPEAICDLTYEELLQLDFGIHKGEEYKDTKIPTLKEFLQNFSDKGLQFAIELKAVGIEKQTLELLRAYGCFKNTIVTSAYWQALKNMHLADPEIRLGYLANLLNDTLLKAAKQCGIGQICPRAAILTTDWNQKLRDFGFSVRPWGIENEELMKRMLALKVDGMTVNFPDILADYIASSTGFVRN